MNENLLLIGTRVIANQDITGAMIDESDPTYIQPKAYFRDRVIVSKGSPGFVDWPHPTRPKDIPFVWWHNEMKLIHMKTEWLDVITEGENRRTR